MTTGESWAKRKSDRWLAVRVVAACLSMWLAPAAGARDLTEILKDKGVISDDEAKEVQKPKPPAQTASAPTLPDWVSRITPFGDVRVRNEAFFRKGDSDRNRDRFRLRFGAKVAVNEETELGFKLASGASGDPISNNQTFTDTFSFKSINIANAYIKLAPSKSLGLDRPWLTVTGGKFDIPLYTPPVPAAPVFDKDLTPEGFYESLKAIESKGGFVRGLALNLGQWIFEENSNTGEAALYAFQGVGNFALGDVLWNVGVGDYHYVDPSSIAVARNKNTSLNITNNVTLSDGTVVGGRPIDPTKFGPNKDGLDADGKAITIKKLNSGFNDLDFATDVVVPTVAPSWPVKIFFQYVKNTEANSDDTGYEAGAGIGANKDPGDVAFTYAFEHLETDAVVSAFSESDFGHDGGTNTEAHIVQLSYVLWKNLTFLSTAYFDEPIDEVKGRNANRDVRWQVDAIAKF
jgi:hypothetical protein